MKREIVSDEIRRLFEAGAQYLEGNSSLAALNGYASLAKQLIKQSRASPTVEHVVTEWEAMINRRWNEWGLEAHPLSETDFCAWLREQLIAQTS